MKDNLPAGGTPALGRPSRVALEGTTPEKECWTPRGCISCSGMPVWLDMTRYGSSLNACSIKWTYALTQRLLVEVLHQELL